MKRRQHRPRRFRITVTLVLLILGLTSTWLARREASFTERAYAHWLFPRIADALGRLSGRTGEDVAEWIIVLGAPLALAFVAAAVRRAMRTRSVTRGFGPPYAWLLGITIAIWSWQLLWGLCYSRPPLAARLGLPAAEASPELLSRLLRELGAETNRAYADAAGSGEITGAPARSASAASTPSGRTGTPAGSSLEVPLTTVSADLARGYAGIFPSARSVRAPDPKFPRVASWIMTRVGISGFYFPLTGEASVNRMMPDVARPFTMAHEMAHQRGVAPEGEANFLAYLTCRESRLAAVRYSGALHAYGLVADALRSARPDSMRGAGGLLDLGPRADAEALWAFWHRYEGRVQDAAEKVNDTYLRANAQAGGIRTYGLAVDLLIAWEAAGRRAPI